VDPGAANKGRRRVAEMAVHRRRQMCGMLACSSITVMTGLAIVYDAGMVENGPDKRPRIVTDAAVLVGRYVTDRFADREHVVMTGAAIVHDTGMVEACRQEPGRHVTRVAVLVCRHVIGWRRLARRRCTVVA
jgi:hypothetical protein